MTQTTPPADQRRFGILLLVFAAVFIAAAIWGGTVVTPWLYLVGVTAVPNVITGVKALRESKSSNP